MNPYLAFILTALAIEITPGPNMGYLVMTALVRGRKTAFVQVAGIALGLMVAGLLSAMGLSRLFEIWPLSYEIVRWVGVAYLLWLAYEAWRDASKGPGDNGATDDQQAGYFLKGLYSNLLNPKAYLFYMSVMPSFFRDGRAIWPQALTLGVIYLTIATSIHALLVLLAGHVQPYFARQAGMIWLGRSMAIGLGLVAIWLIISTHRG